MARRQSISQCRRARIMREIENSLRRLHTDYIDVYQVHWPDPLVAIEETAEAMCALYKPGEDTRHRRKQFFNRSNEPVSSRGATARAAAAL